MTLLENPNFFFSVNNRRAARIASKDGCKDEHEDNRGDILRPCIRGANQSREQSAGYK